MVAADFLQDPRVQGWLDGVEPAWTLLTFESLLALRHEPSAVQSAIQIANDLSVGEIAGSPVARNTLILLGQAIERVGLPLTATGNLSRAAVAEMCKLIEWPTKPCFFAPPESDNSIHGSQGFHDTAIAHPNKADARIVHVDGHKQSEHKSSSVNGVEQRKPAARTTISEAQQANADCRRPQKHRERAAVRNRL